jgi:hypothetical protein
MATSFRLRLRYVYLALCVLGLVLPYWQFVPWFLEHGLDLSLLGHQLVANRVAGFVGSEGCICALVLWGFVFAEGARLGMRGLWLPVIATLLVGVSLGLPLFLYMRQVQLDKPASNRAT